MHARAVEFVAPRRVAVVPIDVSEPRPGELRVRTLWSGISAGTELLAYRGELDPDLPLDERIGALGGTFRYPFRYGYSCVGRVERSRATLPPGALVFGFHPHQDRILVAESDVVPLPEPVPPRLATMFPLVETALQLTLDAAVGPGETVVVLGLGAVGLLTAVLLRDAGATVLAGEPQPWRRELAGRLGVSAVAPEELPAQVAAATADRGVPVAVEVSGAPAALADALAVLAHEGTALVGSWYGERPVTLPLGGAFHRRRLTIRSSQVSTIPAALSARWDVPRRRAAAARLLSVLPLGALATTDVAFEDAASAYAALDRGDPGLLHVALRYE